MNGHHIGIIGPETEAHIRLRYQVTGLDWRLMRSGEVELHLSGHIIYHDLFGKRHVLMHRHLWSEASKGFSAVPGGNRYSDNAVDLGTIGQKPT
jgi:hypothetical protein